MKYIHIFFIVVVLLGSFFPGLCVEAKMGETLELVEDEPLTIRAEILQFLPEDTLFVAEGSVEVTYRQARLTADRVEFNQMTGDAVAIGNVLYEEEGETLKADWLELNLDSELGIIYHGELALEDDQYITGEEIKKTGDKTYLIKKGCYTACSSPWPAWKFRSTRSKVHEGEYLQAWNTVGYIKGIPIIYFPYFIFPIKTERQTGFLVPDLGNSISNGFTISNTFFWAISPSQDATLRHTFYEKRGHKLDLEYRYIYSDQTDGRVDGQYIRDEQDLTERKRLKWNHRHGLPYDVKARINLDLTSDDQFDEDFSTRLDERANRKLRSNLSFTKNYSELTVLLLLDRLDDLREESSDRTDQRFPELQITSQNQPLFGTPLYFQQKTQISRLKRQGKKSARLEFERIDIQPTLSLPLKIIGQALTINPELQLRETYYTRNATTAADPELEAEPTHREYYATALRVDGPKLYRVFEFDPTRRIQKLKHLIEPSAYFSYAPAIDEKEFPKFDGIDRIGSDKRRMNLSYGITQRLLIKRVRDTDWEKFQDSDEDITVDELNTETRELASLSVNQSYNFEAEEYPFSNIDLTLKTRPFEDYDLTLRTTYDVYINTFVRTDVDFSGSLWDFLDFDVRWRRNLTVDRDTDDITKVNQFLDVGAQLSLFEESLGLSYRGRFNVEERERIEDSFGLTYNAQCWNIVGYYTQQQVGEELDKNFQIVLELKHLGRLFDIKSY